MSRAVVTGGSGFLGSHIADVLADRGHDVVIFDRAPSPYLRDDQRMEVGDILDRKRLESVVRGADSVYHLAGLADLGVASERPLEATEINVVGTVNALEAARQGGAERFLFASTVYVYSRAGGFYRCSKQACEAYVEEYQRQYGLDFTILRYGSLYGPRADAGNGVHRLLRQAAAGTPIEHLGRPDDAREYVHVQDAARLSVDALATTYVNERLVVTGHHPTRIKDLFTMFSEILGRPLEVEYREPEGGLASTHYRLTPYAFSPRPGLKLTANCYVDMGQGILQMLEELAREER